MVGLPLLFREGEKVMGEGVFKGATGRRVERGYDWDVK